MTVFSDDGSAIQYNEFEGIAISSEHHTGILNHRCKKKNIFYVFYSGHVFTRFFILPTFFFYFLKTFIENTYDCCILLIV